MKDNIYDIMNILTKDKNVINVIYNFKKKEKVIKFTNNLFPNIYTEIVLCKKEYGISLSVIVIDNKNLDKECNYLCGEYSILSESANLINISNPHKYFGNISYISFLKNIIINEKTISRKCNAVCTITT
jgi:hypothetical protein